MTLWKILRFSPARALAVAALRTRTGRRALRGSVRLIGKKRLLRLVWRAVRL